MKVIGRLDCRGQKELINELRNTRSNTVTSSANFTGSQCALQAVNTVSY